jgi:hypothetical protein
MKNWALAAFCFLLVISCTSAGAQSYVESNARDAVCEWQYKNKRGIEKCHIIAMGTHAMNSLVFMLRIDGMTVSLVDEDGRRTAEIGQGGFWDFKSKWRGSYGEKTALVDNNEDSFVSNVVYKLSNGYTIKIVY